MTGEAHLSEEVVFRDERINEATINARRFLGYMAVYSEESTHADDHVTPTEVPDLILGDEAYVSQSTFMQLAVKSGVSSQHAGRILKNLERLGERMTALKEHAKRNARLSKGQKLMLGRSISSIHTLSPEVPEVAKAGITEPVISLTGIARAIEDQSLRRGHSYFGTKIIHILGTVISEFAPTGTSSAEPRPSSFSDES